MERAAFALLSLVIVGLLVYLSFRLVKTPTTRSGPELPGAVVTQGRVVVSYRADPEKMDAYFLAGGESGVSQKLREILAAHPEADLGEFQAALGIIVTTVQRRKRETENVDGIVLGDE